jgi:putative oxidoreductase
MTSILPLLGRLLIAAIFVMSGLGKLSDPAGTTAYIASVGLPMADIATWAAILVELGGGILLIAGFQTRLVAFARAGFCVVSAALFHNQFGDRMQMINFMKNLAMAGGLLQVVAFGAGSFSLDAALKSRSAR